MSGIYFSNSGLSMVNISSRYREVSLNFANTNVYYVYQTFYQTQIYYVYQTFFSLFCIFVRLNICDFELFAFSRGIFKKLKKKLPNLPKMGTKTILNSRVQICFASGRPLCQQGTIYNIGDILQIGRFSSSGDNFVSDSGDCLFVGRTDFQQKKRKSHAHFILHLRILQLSISEEDKKRGPQTRVF